MKLRLISDGTFQGTFVEEVDGHGVLENVQFVSYFVKEDGLGELTIRILGVPAFIGVDCQEMQITTDQTIQYKQKRISS